MKCERCLEEITGNYAKVPHPITEGIYLIFCQECCELTGNKSLLDEYFTKPDPKNKERLQNIKDLIQ